MPAPVRFLDAAAIRAALSWPAAVAALEDALLAGFDPEADVPRISAPAPDGEFLLMPASGRAHSGVKVLTVAPNNPARGFEKIQGIYYLVDSATLSPVAILDGAELTAVRTPAVTLLALARIARAPGAQPFPEAPRFLVYGAGVQAVNHIRAARALFPRAVFQVVGRRPERVAALIETLAEEGVRVTAGSDADLPAADVVVCATTSSAPLFDGNDVAPHAVVAAVGMHGHGVREVDEVLVRRSDVVVESRGAIRHEGGDLVPARSVEEWERIRPANLLELVRGDFRRTPGRPCLYNGVGMSWQDLAIAAAVHELTGAPALVQDR